MRKWMIFRNWVYNVISLRGLHKWVSSWNLPVTLEHLYIFGNLARYTCWHCQTLA